MPTNGRPPAQIPRALLPNIEKAIPRRRLGPGNAWSASRIRRIRGIRANSLSDSVSVTNSAMSDKIAGMSTATMRPQLQIRPAREEDAAPLCEIFNEAVQDRLETFDSVARAVEDQRLLIAAAEQDPKHPILVADVRNWIAGWV